MYYEITICQFAKMLRNFSGLLDKAQQYADLKKVDPEVLLRSRLAPDQFDFTRQVQIACDTAKFCAVRLTGKEAPAHPDTEKTIPELKARLESVATYLETFKAGDFVEAGKRTVSQPRWEGKTLTGEEFAIQHAIPNFYFHVTTGYSILRHNGVDIGKKDFLGAMPFKK